MRQLDPFAMLENMAPGLFDWWIAFGRVEPFGDEWRQAAVVASEIRLVRSMFSETRPFELEDFMPIARAIAEEDQPPETPEQRQAREQAVLKLGLGIKG